jgi:hypothetical protein
MYQSFWSTHGEVYLAKCKENGVTPNSHAMPPQMATKETNDSKQTNIADFLGPTPVKWTKDGLREMLLPLVVKLNKVCHNISLTIACADTST